MKATYGIILSVLFNFIVPTVYAQMETEVAFPNLVFFRPVDIQNSGDGTNRLFVVEQDGVIVVFENRRDAFPSKQFLNIQDKVFLSGSLEADEAGLLGLAFHPDYETNGYFFVNYIATNSFGAILPYITVVARYSVSEDDPDKADEESELILLQYEMPFANLNGGSLQFGSDGYLYISAGDGGGGGDLLDNAQNRENLLGTILRIDVDNPAEGLNYGIPEDNPFVNNTSGYREEIFAYGFRDPLKMSFDQETGWLWVGDRGQDGSTNLEEVNIVGKGKNYGWRTMEGSICFFPPIGCDTTGLEMPVWEYLNDDGNRKIVGGYVYRGTQVPELEGAYIYGDRISDRIWALRYDGENPPSNTEIASVGPQFGLSTFGVDENNELYFASIWRSIIYRFTATVTDVEERTDVPITNHLAQNYPNPFNLSTTIQYSVARNARVEISIYDLRGRIVRMLENQEHAPGDYKISWDGKNNDGIIQSSGVYLYRLKVGDGMEETKRMVLLK